LRWQPSAAPPNSGNVHHIPIEEGLIMSNESNIFLDLILLHFQWQNILIFHNSCIIGRGLKHYAIISPHPYSLKKTSQRHFNDTRSVVVRGIIVWVMWTMTNKTRGVSHCSLAIYIKTYLTAKEDLWKLKYFIIHKCSLQKIL
jgi:hypothetical protein